MPHQSANKKCKSIANPVIGVSPLRSVRSRFGIFAMCVFALCAVCLLTQRI
jgi:hypothetical protein